MGEIDLDEIIKDEIVLGTFMGLPRGNYVTYRRSWDGLHNIIDKINGMGKGYNVALFKTYISISVESGGKVYKDFSFAHSENVTPEQSPRDAAFKALVKFVKWYNENKQDNE